MSNLVEEHWPTVPPAEKVRVLQIKGFAAQKQVVLFHLLREQFQLQDFNEGACSKTFSCLVYMADTSVEVKTT